MISTTDIQNLANLARIEVTEAEAEKMTKELDSILGYVGQIQSAAVTAQPVVSKHRNVLREDVVTTTPGEHTEALLANVPARDGNYVKVKKILN